MPCCPRATQSSTALLLAAAIFGGDAASAQQAAPVYGFEVSAPAFPTGIERQRQPDLWMLDVEFKPMRMRYVDVTNPVTGRKERKQIWYLVYRAYNRPIRGAGTTDDTQPVNDLDTPLTRPLFQPRLTVVTYDERGNEIPNQTVKDQPWPEAVQQLSPVENRRDVKIVGSVDLIQELPEASDEAKPLYGVAVFPEVDPETDYFKVILSGFTNAYELRAEEDGTRVWRKALVQRFTRRGDRYDPNQVEFEFDGDPEWVYLPGETIENKDVVDAGAGVVEAGEPPAAD